MSFALTTDQVRDRTKTVTRRDGWRFAKVGDRYRPVLKGMGLKPGEKIQPLLDGLCIEVVSLRLEPLEAITQDDVNREGFPEMTPAEFVAMYRKHGDKAKDGMINRIEFKYVGVDT